MPLMPTPVVVLEITLRSAVASPPTVLLGEFTTSTPVPTGVLDVLLFKPMMLPATVSPPSVASTWIPVLTFSMSNPLIVSFAPETSRPIPVVPLRALPSMVRKPPATVEASIVVPAAVRSSSGVDGLIVGVTPGGRSKVIASPSFMALAASMAARKVHSGTWVAELLATVWPVSQLPLAGVAAGASPVEFTTGGGGVDTPWVIDPMLPALSVTVNVTW